MERRHFYIIAIEDSSEVYIFLNKMQNMSWKIENNSSRCCWSIADSSMRMILSTF